MGGEALLSVGRAGRGSNGPGLFVYGTLMDADVRTMVIGRPLEPAQIRPARLKNMRRVYIAGRLYPMVVPRRGAEVEGLLLSGLSQEDFVRLDAFEGDYRRERQNVWPLNETGQAEAEPALVWFYRTRGAGAPASPREWRLADWQTREKAQFLRGVRAWLAGSAK